MLRGVSGSRTLVQSSSGLSTADQNTVKQNLGLPSVAFASQPYIAGRSYIVGVPGASYNGTNTQVTTSDTAYGVIGYINAPVTISTLATRTSSSNASAGAQVKFGIYNMDAATGVPTTLVAQTAAQTIGDAAINTVVSQTIGTPPTLQPGFYLFCLLTTFVTTAPRFLVYTSTTWWGNAAGASSIANTFSGPIGGYKSADGAMPFAAGFLSSFGTATQINAVANSAAQQLPGMSYTAS